MEEAAKSQSPRLILEMAAVDLCFSEPLEPIGDLLERFEALESRLQGGSSGGVSHAGPPVARPRPSTPAAATSSSMVSAPVAPAVPSAVPSASPAPSAAPAPPVVVADPLAPPAEIWRRILSTFEAQRPRLAGMLAHAEVAELAPGRLSLVLPDRFTLDQAEKARGDIEQALSGAFGQAVRLTLGLGGSGAAPVLRSEVRAENDVLAADRKNRENEARQHPMVRKAQDLFGAALKEIKT